MADFNKKKALFRISTNEEKRDFELLELAELNKNYEEVMRVLRELGSGVSTSAKSKDVSSMMLALADGIKKIKTDYNKHSQASIDAFKEMQEEFLKGLGTLKETMKSQDPATLTVPLYKSMINAISGVEKAVTDKPVPVWRWPQYASVSVRNKSFTNIDPAQNDQANSVGTGNRTVATGGVAVQLSTSSVPCCAVYIQAHESNTNAITVGDSNVVAALSGRRGYTLYPTNTQKFVVNNLNLLWIDAITNGDKCHFYYEIP